MYEPPVLSLDFGSEEAEIISAILAMGRLCKRNPTGMGNPIADLRWDDRWLLLIQAGDRSDLGDSVTQALPCLTPAYQSPL